MLHARGRLTLRNGFASNRLKKKRNDCESIRFLPHPFLACDRVHLSKMSARPFKRIHSQKVPSTESEKKRPSIASHFSECFKKGEENVTPKNTPVHWLVMVPERVNAGHLLGASSQS